ncbi:MAG TPA: multiheme c-type cytochrome [Thermoanaerobaculia bacterium]|nr:multiheme c-type cytochrome [Thermoanaerobaculia bacterium]
MANGTTFRTGWTAGLTKLALATLVFEAATGLLITLAPFHAVVEWNVLLHTAVGLATLVPLTWYFAVHWLDYRRFALSDVVLLGYVAVAALLVCSVSGLVVTWQGLFALKMSGAWRNVHLVSTLVALAAALPHVALVYVRVRGKAETARPARRMMLRSLAPTVAGLLAIAGLAALYSGPTYVNELPEDYQLVYGEDRPFAPSLATTETGGALDARSLAGSESCGTAGCHEQIVEEWQPSAHRYAAMDPFFQEVQTVMAQQNGPESTRYCGGCHDPISLFSGAKNVFAEDLTGQLGFQEGVSCLACHGIRETDLQGNANFVMSQPPAYLFQWAETGAARVVRDFLIRTYPDEHARLSKRAFKAPEYCAACHKQFIDEEVNRVGWVQLQNQYDNWKASYWYVEGEPERTIECRECHMPLVDSRDPAAGDAVDYNRSPRDGKHRSHRFIAANSMVPEILELPGWQEQVRLTEEWLKGHFEIPEIADKWADGPVVELDLRTPPHAVAGEAVPIRVVMTASKVGHDFPTGPLDIIQSWVEIRVTDEAGNEVFSSGTRDERHFIEPGSFLFKAEPVDQYGNLIDRHNLWEMVGVRYRRALFPGYSDTVEYLVDCPGSPGMATEGEAGAPVQDFQVPAPAVPGKLHVVAKLNYRKVDQSLLNFLLGEDNQLTSPVIEMTRVERTLEVRPPQRAEGAKPAAGVQVGAGGG